MSTESLFDQHLNVLASDDATQRANSYVEAQGTNDAVHDESADIAAIYEGLDNAIQMHSTFATLVLYANSLANSEMQLSQKLKHEGGELSNLDDKIIGDIYKIRSRYYDLVAKSVYNLLVVQILKTTALVCLMLMVVIFMLSIGVLNPWLHIFVIAVIVVVYCVYFYLKLSYYWRRDRQDPTRIVHSTKYVKNEEKCVT